MKRKKVTKKVEPNKKSSKSEEKVFDIASPGKSMPSASSRPVIVSHKPNVSDPMMASAGQKSEAEEKEEKSDTPSVGEGAEMVMAAPKKNRIEPLHADVTPDDLKPEAPEETNEKPSSADAAPEPATSDEQQKEDDGEPEEIADAASEVTTKKQAQSEAAKQQAEAEKRQAEVEALINNKQFFVPINAVQKRRSVKLVIFIIVLILLLIGFFALWDAEVFDLSMQAPTDFF